MEIFLTIVFALILLLVVLGKGAVGAFHPENKMPITFASKETREYSPKALKMMESSGTTKETVEFVIEQGQKTKGTNGFKFRHAIEGGQTILVFTDLSGNVTGVSS